MTRLFGVIGSPIQHSLSPAMHAAAFHARHLDARYAAWEVPVGFLQPVLRALILSGVEGLNVTVPLKEAVLPLLDRVDHDARAMGAVNAIVIRNRRTMGCNTDGAGFRRALAELGWCNGPWRAVLLGAGGAARAVAWELTRARGSQLTIANRHLDRARRLARWLAPRRPQARIRTVPLRDVTLDAADLLINATTVGMHAGDGSPIEPERLHRALLVYDLVYHRQTPLVLAAKRRGGIAANGLSMLLYQGAESFRLWFHRDPPIDAMRAALLRTMRNSECGLRN